MGGGNEALKSELVTPQIYNAFYPDPVFVYGEPLLTFGLSNHGAVNGLGLVSNGLLWQLFDLWCDVHYYSTITTSWSAASGATVTSTTWAAASGATVTSTTWTSPQYGMFGPYPTI